MNTSTQHPDSTHHPEPVLLAAFLDGRLSEQQRLEVEAHVDCCPICCDAMSRLPLDPLSARLRDISDDDVDDNSDWSIVTDPGLPRSASPTQNAAPVLPAELHDHPRYRVLEPLGRGGMGVVYKAQHRMMDRIVALKVIDSRLIDNPQMIDRFRNEVKAAALLNHANIVRAYDAEQAGSLHFLVMEYVDGISLAELIQRKGPLPAEQALGVVRKVAHGLQHAYQHGMVHRDIKPQNIMVTRTGKVRILDFGLARFAREREHSAATTDADPDSILQRTAESLTLVGSILGTPDYIAPEQVMDAHQADTRADIYSLGCTGYFLLTGRPPFPDGTAVQKLMAHRDQTPIPVTELRADVSPEITSLIERMMARDPDHRFQTPLEVATAIHDLNTASTSSDAAVKSEAAGDRTDALRLDSASSARPPAPSAAPTPSATRTPSSTVDAVDGPDVFSHIARRQDAVSGRRVQRAATKAVRWTKPIGVTVLTLTMLLVVGLTVHESQTEPEPAPDSTPRNTQTASESLTESPMLPTEVPIRVLMPGEWMNLIPQIDPSRDTVAGVWQNVNGELSVEAAVSARLVLPVAVPAEYDFDIEFTRHDGVHSIALVFAVGDHQATYDIDAWGEHVAGIQNIGGQSIQPSRPNSTMVPSQQLVNGQRYSAEVRVRRDHVQAWLNGQLLTTYHGDGSDLSLIPEWRLPGFTDSLAIGAYESSTTFHRIRVRAVQR
ncbi:MAG: protein kinase [Planctomycetaceae bacterium]